LWISRQTGHLFHGKWATHFAEMGHPLEKEADDGAGVR
jgi:hypothetical protein